MPTYGIPTWESPRMPPWRSRREFPQQSTRKLSRAASPEFPPHGLTIAQFVPEYWSKLPAEISLMILDMVVEDYSFQPSMPFLRAGYATVCREWQPVFEQQNFRRLVLDFDRILYLEDFTSRHDRRGYIEQIFLCVRLDAYDCSVCQTKENEDQIHRNNYFFTKSLYALLSVLSQWKVLEPSPGRYGRKRKGLELEIGAYSPSDYRHTFREPCLEPLREFRGITEAQTYLDDAYHQRNDQLVGLNDRFHGWVDGRRDDGNTICLEAKQRLMGTLEITWVHRDMVEFCRDRESKNLADWTSFVESKHLDEVEFLPEVEIVTSLLIRREFHRKISASSVSKLLKESFTNLIDFRREGWVDVDPQQPSDFSKELNTYLYFQELPSTLRNLYMFEESNNLLHLSTDAAVASERRWRHSLAYRLSNRSRLLESISVAFLIDARYFLDRVRPYPNPYSGEISDIVVPWKNLRSLSLTTELLRTSIRSILIRNLLLTACRAVAFMPKLELLEIWNANLIGGDPTAKGKAGTASVFRYEYKDQQPTITFATNSIWLSKIVYELLQGDVGSIWNSLPRHGPDHRLTYKMENILGITWCRSYPSVIEKLQLKGHILHELSRCQMACENPVLRKEEVAVPNFKPARTSEWFTGLFIPPRYLPA